MNKQHKKTSQDAERSWIIYLILPIETFTNYECVMDNEIDVRREAV